MKASERQISNKAVRIINLVIALVIIIVLLAFYFFHPSSTFTQFNPGTTDTSPQYPPDQPVPTISVPYGVDGADWTEDRQVYLTITTKPMRIGNSTAGFVDVPEIYIIIPQPVVEGSPITEEDRAKLILTDPNTNSTITLRAFIDKPTASQDEILSLMTSASSEVGTRMITGHKTFQYPIDGNAVTVNCLSGPTDNGWAEISIFTTSDGIVRAIYYEAPSKNKHLYEYTMLGEDGQILRVDFSLDSLLESFSLYASSCKHLSEAIVSLSTIHYCL